MTMQPKKGIRIDLERVQKIINSIDKAIKDNPMQVSIYELFVAFYIILRNADMQARMKERDARMKAQEGKGRGG